MASVGFGLGFLLFFCAITTVTYGFFPILENAQKNSPEKQQILSLYAFPLNGNKVVLVVVSECHTQKMVIRNKIWFWTYTSTQLASLKLS